PAAARRALVHLLRVEERGRVRDVADPLERLLGRRARVGLDPVGAESVVAADRYGEVGAAEEAGHDLPRRLARHHELARDGRVLLADAAAVPGRADHRP